MTCRDLAPVLRSSVARLAALLVLAASPLLAVGGLDGPNQPLGIVSGMPYTGGEYGGVDAVSAYAGSLNLAIPIGQGFRVGNVAYGFTLLYNSNVWTYAEGADEAQPNGFVKAELNTTFNAGLGWQLSLGRLLKPNQAPNTSSNWIYLGPDGSSHKFFYLLHTSDGNDNNAIKYTRDGSYLRLNIASPSFPVVEFPDGTSHVFNGNGWPVTLRDSYKDAAGNYLNTVTITYPNATTWTIADWSSPESVDS